jgi:hypothetical protein
MGTLAILAIFCSLMRQISLKDVGLADINTTDAKYYISRAIRLLKVDLDMVFSLIAGGALAFAGATAGKAGALAFAGATAGKAGALAFAGATAGKAGTLAFASATVGKGAFIAPQCLPAAGAWGGAQALGYGAYHGCLPAAGAWGGAQALGYGAYHGCVPCATFYWF